MDFFLSLNRGFSCSYIGHLLAGLSAAMQRLLSALWVCVALPRHYAFPQKDAMIGFAAGYNHDVIFRLAHAYSTVTTAHQELVLFVTLSSDESQQLQRRFPTLKLLRTNRNGHAAYRRYPLILRWLKKNRALYDRIILTDTRDIAIYSDPFVQFDNATEPLMIFTEVVPYHYDRWYNQPWVRNCYGQAFLDTIMHEMVTCCGVVAGLTDAVIAYLKAFVHQLAEKRLCDPAGADTAIHVYITHSVLLGVQTVNSEVARIRHAPAWGPNADAQVAKQMKLAKHTDLHRPLLNALGQPFAMIHQLDRFPALWNAYISDHRPPGNCQLHGKLVATDVKDTTGATKWRMAVYEDDHISTMIRTKNGWEIHNVQQMADLVDQRILPPSAGGFLDIGGNIGYYSLLFAHAGYNVTYVEPLPRNRAAMQASLCMNPALKERVTVVAAALSEKPQSKMAGVTCRVIGDWWESNWGNGHIECGKTANCANHRGTNPCEDVQVQTLDSVLARVGVTAITAVKMDIEGHECPVLRGGSTLFTKYRPPLIQYEGQANLGAKNQDCVAEILRARGYSIGTKRGHDGNTAAWLPQAPLLLGSADRTDLENACQAPHKLPVCIGILAFQGHKTLDNTLASYKNSGLLDLVAEAHILFQDVRAPKRRSWAKDVVRRYPQLRPMYKERNVGQREGFIGLNAACTQKFAVVLEEDFEVDKNVNVCEQLMLGIAFIDSGRADAVRLRSRKNGGFPNYAYDSWKHGTLGSMHRIEHVMWNDRAEDSFPEIKVCLRSPKAWCTTAQFGQYTNNPVLYKTAFAKELFNRVPAGHDFEPWLTTWWKHQPYTIMYCEGIFTHRRIDRALGSL